VWSRSSQRIFIYS